MNIGVFCASADHIREEYFNEARKLGEEIARRSWCLVYGGTTCGLMKVTAEAALQNGGKVTGIIPECIADRGVAAQNITSLILVKDMKERKELLRSHSDAFIALPGGWGTLEEITEVITLKQLGIHNKPIVFVNTIGYYDLFFAFIKESGERGFISAAYDDIFTVVGTVEEAIYYISHYQERQIVSKYDGK